MKYKKSKFEVQCAEVLEQGGFTYETYKLPYIQKSVYTPDFTLYDIHVECKGWFRPGDIAKYKAVREFIPETHELVFLLMKPTKPVRKGAALTMAGWCTKEGFRWFSDPVDVLNYATQCVQGEDL